MARSVVFIQQILKEKISRPGLVGGNAAHQPGEMQEHIDAVLFLEEPLDVIGLSQVEVTVADDHGIRACPRS